MKSFEKIMAELPRARRAKIEAGAKMLIAEERALQQLRKARNLTQQRMAELLCMDQGSVSKIENRSDMLLSTFRSYVEAMGGSLRLVAQFRDGTVEIGSFSDPGEAASAPAKKKAPAARVRARRKPEHAHTR
jgi:DNA-binding XRE family transcriptional regulator